MKKISLLLLISLIVLSGLALTIFHPVSAQELAITLTHSVIGSGGMGGSAGGYTLSSTLGQPVTGSVSGGDYALSSGFWGQALMEWFENFLPLVLQ